MSIKILSAGAAMGLVRDIEVKFRGTSGLDIVGSFGAVGAMKERFLAGESCDVIILTETQIHALAVDRKVDPSTVAAIGRVPTGVAVCADAPIPRIDDREGLRSALIGASAIYFPDPARATAGIHFAGVLKALAIAPVLRTFPNGAEAMRAMALTQDHRAIGCTQVTEILYTEGVSLVGSLPEEFALVTTYAAAMVVGAPNQTAARRFIELLSSSDAAPLRAASGFA